MKTLQSDLQGTLERFRADMARRDTDMADLRTDLRTDMARRDTDMADLKTDMARRDTEAGKRENRLLITMIVVVGVATAVLGALITAQ